MPIIAELPTETQAQEAVTPTKPANTPLIIIERSGLPRYSQAATVEATAPKAAAVLVVMAMCAIAPGSTAIVEPGLKPNQPNHKIKQPKVAMLIL